MYRTLSALVIAAFLTDTTLGGVVIIFTDAAAFEAFNLAEGKVQKLTEDFEESNLGDFGVAQLLGSLQGNIQNVDEIGNGFPKGLTSKNLIIQSNILGLNATMPSDGAGLLVLGFTPGLFNSVVVSADAVDSLDLIFTEPNHTGVGFDVIGLAGAGSTMHIAVFDKGGVLIHKEILPTPSSAKTFFGIWSPDTIGRINIGGVDALGELTPEFVDNIQMWVPAPGTLALLGLAGLMGARRRRR